MASPCDMGSGYTFQTPIVGRRVEIDRIEKGLTGRRPLALIITGNPGSGKTRLLMEAGRIAGKHNVQVVVPVLASQELSRTPLQALASAWGSAGFRIPATAADAVAEIARLHRRTPLMISVDDAHLLDNTSAAVIAQLMHLGACHVAVACPNNQDCSAELLRTYQSDNIDRIFLSVLEEHDTATLCHKWLGAPLHFTTLLSLMETARGNLTALHRMLVSAQEAGMLVKDGSVWTVAPDSMDNASFTKGVARTICPELKGLSKDEMMALESLSILRAAPRELARQLADETVWEELEERALIRVSYEEGRHLLEFTDPLLHATTRAKILPLRRRHILCRILRAISEAPVAFDPIQVMLWNVELRRGVDLNTLLGNARRAWWAGDWRAAQALAQAAWNQQPGPETGLFYLQLLAHHGKHRDADELLQPLRSTPHAHHILFRAEVARNSVKDNFSHDSDSALASSLAVSTPASLRLVDKALKLLMEGECRVVWDAVRPLLKDGTDPEQVAMAGSIALVALLRMGRPRDCLNMAPRLEWAVRNLSDHHVPMYDALNIPVLLAYARAQCSDSTGFQQLHALIRQAAAVRNEILASRAGCMLARLRFTEGRIQEAYRLFAGSGPDGDLLIMRQLARSGELMSAAHQGDPVLYNASVSRIDTFLSAGSTSADLELARSVVAFNSGNKKEAIGVLGKIAAFAANVGAYGELADVVHMFARQGRAELSASYFKFAAEVQGDLDKTRFDFSAAVAKSTPGHVETCAERFEELAAPLYAAEAWAVAYKIHKKNGDQKRAAGVARNVTRARQEYDGVITFLLRDVQDGQHLTNREHEIASLAASGLASQEIAEKLFISVRTVDNHLHRIYRKLGISRRRELRSLFLENPG
ncbi:LuxR C-terminal-related transcriptional regulator [Streptomyces chartreusis]|uniref:LuxR C-terminal-related transcriptional regulator n=1 Tax=Streptomyces chartreusis TaxID=1969 RepID=UPI0036CBCAA7